MEKEMHCSPPLKHSQNFKPQIAHNVPKTFGGQLRPDPLGKLKRSPSPQSRNVCGRFAAREGSIIRPPNRVVGDQGREHSIRLPSRRGLSDVKGGEGMREGMARGTRTMGDLEIYSKP